MGVSLLQWIKQQLENCSDVNQRSFPHIGVELFYSGNLVDIEKLYRDVIDPMLYAAPEQIRCVLEQSPFRENTNNEAFITGILGGNAGVIYQDKAYEVDIAKPPTRAIQETQVETVITGPHDSFVESATMNVALIRKRIKSPTLKSIKFQVGETTKSDIFVLFIEDVANPDVVKELLERISRVRIDAVFESNMFAQLIDDNPYSIFPQFISTERPDVAVSKLVEGKVVCIVDSGASAICAPTSFFEFFASADDYYQRWALGTGIRLLRFVAFVISVAFTAFYVSVTTFHYEMIPQTLLLNLAESRSRVPFPPLFEALLMEVTIELLREAGARLPTKIGQTIGIVGGIVIGQAAVDAGLTSNILIIAVASSAIASFVIPSYIMSASIRLLRFGLIILAGIWGNLGLMFGVGLIAIHLSNLHNLNIPYLTPVAPAKFTDWKDTLLRAPFQFIKKNPHHTTRPRSRAKE